MALWGGARLSWGTCAGIVGILTVTSFDVYWFVRLMLTRLASLVRKPLSLTDEGVVYSLCTTNDIDYFCHMNNGRYFRELDFARFDFYFRSGLDRMFRSMPNTYVVQHAASIRYRRSLDFLMPFAVKTRLIWFDERSLYFEQKFVSLHDNFIRAVALCKNTAVNCDVLSSISQRFPEIRQPDCPLELEKFIESQAVSSNRLRLSGHEVSVASSLQHFIPAAS